MILGHQKQWKFLKKSAELERISHSLLFYGEEKLGKKTIALEFIKLLNCQNPQFSKRPCQICRSCQDIQKRQHTDVLLIEPINKEIQISQIRDLSWKLALKPYSASIKSAIIDKAHFMNREAQSCFLKTLEEPKGKTLLILITEYPEILLPTILSRVQKIKFYPIKRAEIEKYLLTQGVSQKFASKISQLSLGKPGEALDFLLDPKKIENQEKRLKELISVLNSNLVSRFQYAKDLSLKPQNLKEILEIWLRYFRDILFSNIDHPSEKYSLKKLKSILKLIQNTIFFLSTTNVNPRLALENLLMEL
ncbi:hypothetical protein KJA15_00565 [Patescibacteria group bacterium]|nr:hypothetical protein [Patescibacteria group bacterium]